MDPREPFFNVNYLKPVGSGGHRTVSVQVQKLAGLRVEGGEGSRTVVRPGVVSETRAQWHPSRPHVTAAWNNPSPRPPPPLLDRFGEYN
jgi:hypothetical protein